MFNSSEDYLNVWLFFWPVLTVVSYLAYFLTSKKQGKKIGFIYSSLIFGAFIVWLAVLLIFKA